MIASVSFLLPSKAPAVAERCRAGTRGEHQTPVEHRPSPRTATLAPSDRALPPERAVFRRCECIQPGLSSSCSSPRTSVVSEAPQPSARVENDDVVVRLTSERLADALGKPPGVVETTVRDELERLRAAARIQTFVPIFAERSARNRLAS